MNLKKISNFVLLVIVVIVNYLAVVLPLGGMTTGEISDLFPLLLTPSNLTFSIWGIIYLTLFFTLLIPLFKDSKRIKNEEKVLGKLFIINCIANALWIVCWQYGQYILSLLMMLIILFTLYKINSNKLETTPLFKITFSIYFGWISVATLLNILAVFYFLTGVNPNYMVTVLLMLLATASALYFGIKKGKPVYGLTVAWALFGNYLKHGFILPMVLVVVIIVSIVVSLLKCKDGCFLK